MAARIGGDPSQESLTAEISQSLRNVHIPASSSAVGSLAAAVLLRGASPRSQVTKWSGRQTAQAEAGGVLFFKVTGRNGSLVDRGMADWGAL